MTINRNLNLNLATRQVRISNRHIDRTINILTRRDNNVAVLVDLNRDVIAILILRRNLGVIILIGDLDTSVLRILSRINRLHTRVINRGLRGSRLFFLDRNLCGNRLTRPIRIRHQDWNGVLADLCVLRWRDLNLSVRCNSDPVRCIDLLAIRISQLCDLMERSTIGKLLTILVLWSFHRRGLSHLRLSILVLRLKFTILANLVHSNEGVLSNHDAVSVDQLRYVSTWSCKVRGSQGTLPSVCQGVDWAVFTDLFTVRTIPNDLVVTRERQCTR